MGKKILFTIGHSTRPLEEFIVLLKVYEIEMVVDVRTIPKSRHNPQFNEKELKKGLKHAEIEYCHLSKLGGLRHTTKESPNVGWHNRSFRGFADYMLTPDFKMGIEELSSLAKTRRCAIMCAEAVPWRCHRSLIADYLTVHKWEVYHIISKNSAKLHELTLFLHIQKGQLIYI